MSLMTSPTPIADALDNNIKILPHVFALGRAEEGAYIINHLMLLADSVRSLEQRSAPGFTRRVNRMRLAGLLMMACSAAIAVYMTARLFHE